MDSSAIKRIEELAASNTALSTHIPAVVLPKDCTVASLEKLLEHPTRIRAAFSTTVIKAFTQYLDNNGVENRTVISIDTNQLAALAILDFGDTERPGWSRHTAELRLSQTPEYSAVKNVLNTPLSQRDLLDFLEDWSDVLMALIDDAVIPLQRAIAAVRKIDVRSVSIETA